MNLSLLKLKSRTARTVTVLLALALAAFAGTKKTSDKEKSGAANRLVDSGTFGVLVKGQRVVSETFSIRQENGNSVIKSQLKETASPNETAQKSEVRITPTGELLRYEWSNASGSSLTVVPSNDFLTEKITPSAGAKAAEQAFLMPNTSAILDNNFFVQREVLAWRFLAANCHSEAGNLQCQKGAVEFGVLVPQDRTSMRVRMELVGSEKIPIHGVDRELMHLSLAGDGFEWSLWLDEHDQFKLMRVSIPADDTEVVRD